MSVAKDPLRATLRHDWSSEQEFDDSDGMGVSGQQNAIPLGAVIGF